MTTVSTDEEIAVPYPCPYCGAELRYEVTGWEQADDATWLASEWGIMPHCQAEPEMGTEAWDDWEQNHYYEPYIHQLPVDVKAGEWINEHYRFKIE